MAEINRPKSRVPSCSDALKKLIEEMTTPPADNDCLSRNQPRDTNHSDALEKLMKETTALFVNDDFATAFQKAVEYPKFCPKKLITKFAAIERNSVICGRDIRFLVKFYLHTTSETRLKITSECHVESQKLMKKYRVERKAEGDNVTLHRIAAAFPIIGVNILRQYKIERKFSTPMLMKKKADKFPWCMRTQMCLSLAPIGQQYVADPEYRTVVFAIVVFMYYENKIVSASRKVLLPTEIFEKVLNIAHTVYNDSLIDHEKKRDAWNHVMFDYTENKQSVVNLLNSFRLEIPEAEPAFLNRFEFNDVNKNTAYNAQKGSVVKDKK